MGKTIWAIMGTIFILVGVVAALGVGSYYVLKAIGFEKPDIEITGFFNSDGEAIDGDSQAVVQGVEGVQFITLRINALNRDEVPLTFTIIDASPESFKDSLPINEELVVAVGQYGSWGSGLVDVVPFEGSDVEFTATIRATSTKRDPATKTASAILTVGFDPVSDFDVEINPASNDAVFEEPPADEIPDPEPEPQLSTVRFRTSNLGYTSSTGVALANSCGGSLIAYGRTNGACVDSAKKCDDFNTADLMIPSESGGETGLWIDDGDLCICESSDIGSNTRPRRYTTSDSDASLVSTSLDSFDELSELLCTA